MIPPGHPDFLTRATLRPAPETSCCGAAPGAASGRVERVEVGVDGVWEDAEPRSRRSASTRGAAGRYRWQAAPGEHVLSCRATDAAGDVQPLEQPWNYQGMGNNLVQSVPVTVEE